jgi:hypothetical protein
VNERIILLIWLKEIGYNGMEWIHLAKDRVHWRGTYPAHLVLPDLIGFAVVGEDYKL